MARRCNLFKEFLGNRKSLVLEMVAHRTFYKRNSRTDNTIVAIDISDALIMKAKERVSSTRVHFVVGNAANRCLIPKA
jgi:hypothetical protein